jgi:type IV secretory pathway VirB10-like protein
MRLATVLLTIGLSLGLSGCWFGRKATAIPPSPAPQPKQAPPVQPPEQKPLPMPPPPEIQEPPQITLPAPQKTPPSRPAAKKKKTPATPSQPPQPAEQPPVQPSPPPQLGEILSDAERHQYEAEYAQSLSRARSALQQVSGKSLSPTQRETVERIKTFIQQAEESKGRDLATALKLVRRADVLGQDLLKDFQ